MRSAPFANLRPIITEIVPPAMAPAMIRPPRVSNPAPICGIAIAARPALAKPCPNLPPWRSAVTPPSIACMAIRWP